ncbi:hypothetical protein FUAX_13100 [Fulvitalea axinellae]|uniref:Gliding motility-associated C-terminal domain-containing protein n=1 Tax=Fulvitalea axinellae TaxID=1182444 RepID=A0AAU9CFW3_9BACT|nr:hypothetical protein FUAX_13100 [Fulvitalea axinellae]
MKHFLPLFGVLFFLNFAVLAQSVRCPDENMLGPDRDICKGDTLKLNAGVDGSFFNLKWDDGAKGQYRTVTELGVKEYGCSGYFLSSNLVVNGDFEDDINGFYSEYKPAVRQGDMYGTGYYDVGPSPKGMHDHFIDCDEDAASFGNMLVVNGASKVGARVWYQTISVEAGNQYAFVAKFRSAVKSSPAKLEFSVDGTSLSATPIQLTGNTCQWDEFYVLWTATETKDLEIALLNYNTAVAGNDFVIGEIFFGQYCEFSDKVTVDVKAIPEIDLGDGLTVCDLETYELKAADPAVGVTYLWQDKVTTTNTFTADSTDAFRDGDKHHYWVEAKLGSCTVKDEIRIKFEDTPDEPVLDIPAVAKCEGEKVSLGAGVLADSYEWSTGKTDSATVFTEKGSYWVEASNGICKIKKDFDLDFLESPDVSLGEDAVLCDDEELTLPKTAGTPAAGEVWTYKWKKDGVEVGTDPTYTVDEAKGKYTYIVEVSNVACTRRDTLEVEYEVTPDEIVLDIPAPKCQGETVDLDAKVTARTYKWLGGSSPDQQKNSYTQTGNYSVEASNLRCVRKKDFSLDFRVRPTAVLGDDILLCGDETKLLEPNADHTLTYRWQNGSLSPTFLVDKAGEYHVSISNGDCTGKDTIKIAKREIPVIDIVGPPANCNSEKVQVDLTTVNADEYRWSGGATPQAPVNEFDVAGKYTVEASNFEDGYAGKCVSDMSSFEVVFVERPAPDLGAEDILLCDNATELLDPGTDDTFVYKWYENDAEISGVSTPTFTVDKGATGAGDYTYKVEVANGDCVGEATVGVKYNVTPKVTAIPENIEACEGDVLTLDVGVTAESVEWWEGSTESQVEVSEAGDYFVKVANSICESTHDFTLRYRACGDVLDYPRVITPNSDGFNDRFLPKKIYKIGDYKLKIYNRRGNKVYESGSQEEGWDGTATSEIKEGTYFWVVEYTYIDRDLKTQTAQRSGYVYVKM